MHLLAIAGSTRPGSYNRKLLVLACRLAPVDAHTLVWDHLASIPAYGEHLDDATPPAPVRELRGAVAKADGLLIATPEYNGSVPGALKNAIDWASRPYRENALRGKPAAVIGASTGPFGAVWAQAELRKVLSIAGAHVLDIELPIGDAADAFAGDGSLRDANHAERLTMLMGELVRLADRQSLAPAA